MIGYIYSYGLFLVSHSIVTHVLRLQRVGLDHVSGIPYTGTVINNTVKYYRIRYEDNDDEELNHIEVERYMKKNRGDGTTTIDVGQQMRLRVRLGEWNTTAKESERIWPFYYSINKDNLYRSYREEWHQNGEIQYDCHYRNEHHTYQYTQSENTKSITGNAVPTDIMDTETGWRISGHSPTMMMMESTSNTNETFMDYLLCQEEYITQYYTQIDFQMVPQQIYKLFKPTHKVNIATYGGAIPSKGSIGFVFADEEGNILLTRYGQPSGNDPLTFRSEIRAFLAAVGLVTLLNQYYDGILHCTEPARSKIQVYTDSLSMIKKLKAYDEYSIAPLAAVLDSEWDVLSALHYVLEWFTTYPKINWVKSHQDNKVFEAKEMPLDAYLNSEADELAATGLNDYKENLPCQWTWTWLSNSTSEEEQ
jgi:hypothetical protein